jgi:hypothetical protein
MSKAKELIEKYKVEEAVQEVEGIQDEKEVEKRLKEGLIFIDVRQDKNILKWHKKKKESDKIMYMHGSKAVATYFPEDEFLRIELPKTRTGFYTDLDHLDFELRDLL